MIVTHGAVLEAGRALRCYGLVPVALGGRGAVGGVGGTRQLTFARTTEFGWGCDVENRVSHRRRHLWRTPVHHHRHLEDMRSHATDGRPRHQHTLTASGESGLPARWIRNSSLHAGSTAMSFSYQPLSQGAGPLR